jgi:hypothetical protein
MNEPTHTRVFAAFATLLILVAGLGCGRAFEPATPPGFVDLGDRYGDDEYRATTADGLVLGVRAFENDPPAERPFLVRAIENRMRESGGYALVDKAEVRARNGLEGTQLTFGHDEEERPHLYLVAVFVTEDEVFLVEAGGDKDQFERSRSQIDWAIRNFLPE